MGEVCVEWDALVSGERPKRRQRTGMKRVFGGSAYHSCLLPVVTLFVRQQTNSRPTRHVSSAVAHILPVVRSRISTTGTPVGVSRIAWMSGPMTYITVCCRSLATSVAAILALIASYHEHDEADAGVGQ
jgi:hypothetical protein